MKQQNAFLAHLTKLYLEKERVFTFYTSIKERVVSSMKIETYWIIEHFREIFYEIIEKLNQDSGIMFRKVVLKKINFFIPLCIEIHFQYFQTI